LRWLPFAPAQHRPADDGPAHALANSALTIRAPSTIAFILP
jgi:hypothetical protein